MRRSLRRFAPVALGTLVAASCGAATSSPSIPSLPSLPSIPGLGASLVQYREDEVAHRLQVKVQNRSGVAWRVMTLRLAWEGLDEVPDAAPEYLVADGQRVDLPVDYGDARCAPGAADPRLPDAPAVAVATVRAADGEQRSVAIPIDDVEELLPRLYAVDCRRQFVEDAVGIELRGPWERVDTGGEAVLRGELAVTRRSATERIVVSAVDGSVLLAVRPAQAGAAPLLVLDAGDDEASLPLHVTSARCDAHALGESKKTYVFQVEIDLGDGPEGVIVEPDEPTRPVMFEVVRDGCGLSG